MSPAVLKGLVQALITVSQFFLNNGPGGGGGRVLLLCFNLHFSSFLCPKSVLGGGRDIPCSCAESVGPGSAPAASSYLGVRPPPRPHSSLNPICSGSLSSTGTKLKACSHKNTSHFQGIGCKARLETSFILANFSIIFPVVETCKKCKNQ